MLNTLEELSKKEITSLALNIMELTADNMIKDKEISRLNNIIKEAIEYNEHLIRDAKYHLNLGHLKKMKNILNKGDNDNENS